MNKSKKIIIFAFVGIVLLLAIIGIGTNNSTTTPAKNVQTETQRTTEEAPAQNPIVQTDTSSKNKIEGW